MNPFATGVHDLWVAKGRPSLRTVSIHTRRTVSHTTVAAVLSGKSLPRWLTASTLITVLGGDPADLRAAWEAENEVQEDRRRDQRGKGRRRRWRLARGVVVKPGDTLLFAVTDTADDLDELHQQLSGEFPNNPVRVVAGVQLAVLTRGES